MKIWVALIFGVLLSFLIAFLLGFVIIGVIAGTSGSIVSMGRYLKEQGSVISE